MNEANMDIHKWGLVPGTDSPLGGCAGTVAWIFRESLIIFHAGDTVALLIRNGIARQLTCLHEIDGGIYRYFGLGQDLEIDIHEETLQEYDRILLISDGVTKAYHPVEAAELVEKHDDISLSVSELVRMCRLKGSSDDITAVLIDVGE